MKKKNSMLNYIKNTPKPVKVTLVESSLFRIKMKLILGLLILPHLAFAAGEITDCGEYTVKGIVRAKEGAVSLIVNENTNSEYSIKFKTEEMIKIALFIDTPVIAKIELTKKFNGTYGYGSKIISADKHIADPLNQDTKRFVLNKKLPCN